MNTRIMLAYESPQSQLVLSNAVKQNGYRIVTVNSVESDLLKSATDTKPDIIVIEMAYPGEQILSQLYKLSQVQPTPIVIFAQLGDKETIVDAVNAGITSYIVDGFSAKRLKPIIETAIARFNAFQSLYQELEKTKNKLDDRKHIDKAKGILMRQMKINEDDAYKVIRKLAMDRNIKIGTAACNVIAMAEMFD